MHKYNGDKGKPTWPIGGVKDPLCTCPLRYLVHVSLCQIPIISSWNFIVLTDPLVPLLQFTGTVSKVYGILCNRCLLYSGLPFLNVIVVPLSNVSVIVPFR